MGRSLLVRVFIMMVRSLLVVLVILIFIHRHVVLALHYNMSLVSVFAFKKKTAIRLIYIRNTIEVFFVVDILFLICILI